MNILFTEIMLIIIFYLLLFLASVVRQHKFIKLGLWHNNTYKERIPSICIFLYLHN